MARPVQADAAATKKRILNAASGLFSAKGEGSTSMRDIASDAKVSLATVHHYFGSKADLYKSCVDAMYEELATLRDSLVPAFASGADIDAVIDSALRVLFRFVRTHDRANRLMLRTVIDTGEILPERRDAFLVPLLENGSALLSAATGQTPAFLRMAVLTVNHAVVRYAITSPAELALVTGVVDNATAKAGVSKAQEEEALRRVEDHLVEVARKMLGL
ncbi:MAG: TetR/AcrR family transcriptional regulator [Deltaproteobacteria bacterium]|nr:TetR/AcrR family transcriptional regulator [Deltaproteobacteria bacterium]